MPSRVAQRRPGGAGSTGRRDADHSSGDGRRFDLGATACHPLLVTRWENEDAASAVLVARLHVDLQRVASAVCLRP